MSYNLTGAAQGGNLALGKAGLAAGTTSTYTIANTFTYANKGLLFSKANATNAATPTTDYNTGVAFLPLAAGQSCLFVFGVDVSGNVGVVQSLPLQLQKGIFPSTNDITGGLGAVQMPVIPDALTPFAYLLVEASASLAAPWTFGVGNLSGVAGLTYLFHDVMNVPAQPVIA
jgi:hypothetical protein